MDREMVLAIIRHIALGNAELDGPTQGLSIGGAAQMSRI